MFVGGWVTVLACNNQAEGERCDVLGESAGNDECASGLLCTPARDLNGSSLVDRCCPPRERRANASVAICLLPSAQPGQDGSVLPPPPDAGAEAGDDGGVDGSTADAATADAMDDGG